MTRSAAKSTWMIAGFVLPFLGFAPADAQPQRQRLDPAPKELNLPTDTVSVPMQRYRGWAVVEAMVNGHGPFLFAIDTGAPGLIIDSSISEKMDLDPHPDFGGMQVRVAGPGGGEGLPATLHQTKSLRLGTAELVGIKTIATKLPMGSGIVGIIGMGLFRDCLLTLDYPASKVTMARGELPPADGRDILDFTQPRQRGSHPVLPINVCGKTMEFTLDTGMTGWISFPSEVSEACGLAHGPVHGPKARSVDKEFETKVARLGGNVTIGRHVVQKPHGHLNQDEQREPLIGSRILQEFALTLDQKNSRIRFARESGAPIVPPAYRSPGFGLQNKGEGFVVWGLMPDSPAARAGLKDGDIVVAMNDKPVAEVYERTIWKSILERDSISVRYRKAGQEKKQTVDVAVLTLIP